MTARTKVPVLGLATAAVMFVLDRITKYIMVDVVMRPEGVTTTPFATDKVIEVLPFFNLRMAWNYGISFSLFNSGTDTMVLILLIVQVSITAVLLYYLWRLPNRLMQLAAGLIIGGALGNIVDRAMYGAVADFLDFHWRYWHFPTFNIADTCITIGVGLWLLDAVRSGSHDAAARTTSPKASPQKD
jgi:signal peptidase II